MAGLSGDPTLQDQRAQIAALDRQILEALNRRIRLVQQLKAHKEARGLGFHDPAQEDRLLAALGEANPGPLSEEGLREIFGLILAWSKREAAKR